MGPPEIIFENTTHIKTSGFAIKKTYWPIMGPILGKVTLPTLIVVRFSVPTKLISIIFSRK